VAKYAVVTAVVNSGWYRAAVLVAVVRGVAAGAGVAAAAGVAVAGPALPALGATTPGIGAAVGCAAADPAPVPAEAVAGAGAVAGARAGEPSPGMVACPPCAAAAGVEAG
jgi:hypothetical protein